MQKSFIALVLIASAPAAAMAQEGRLGASSQASVRLTVSVSPRVWLHTTTSEGGKLCVATGGRYELVVEQASTPLKWAGQKEACANGGSAVRFISGSSKGNATVLVRPE